MNLYRVALSTRNKQYLTPAMAVLEPNPISMWMQSPNDSGKGTGVVMRFLLSIVLTVPISTTGSLSTLVI